MHKYLTCCGLFCGACTSMLLHEKNEGDPALKDFSCEYKEEPCPGCGSGCVPDCEFNSCCKAHGVVTCAFCPDYPCARIRNFSVDEWPHHIDVLENLSRMKEIGIEAWIEEQKKCWTCPDCGARTHWYQSKCRDCGASWEPKYV
ncbi:MAG TPA: DUF3795 domain-containing protein [Candidatus Cloacimonadota bacterium]|nr:DUF3795 domain-containing protein [Candidatus Cloacimonadota bacterium]